MATIGSVISVDFLKVPVAEADVRFGAQSGLKWDIARGPKRAKGGSDPDSRRRETAIVRHMRNGSVEPCFLILISEWTQPKRYF
jgi:hypothetical protein